MGFFRREYWSRLLFPTARDFSSLGIEPQSLALPTLAGGFFTTVPPGNPKRRKTKITKEEYCPHMKNKTLPSKFPFHCPEFCHIKTTREHKKFNFKLETLLSILNQSNVSGEVKENVHWVGR